MLVKSVFDSQRDCTPSERRSARRYQIELFGALVTYAALLEISVHTVDRLAAGPGKVIDALLPMIGVLAMSIAIVRFVLRLDELQRQTFVVSAAITAIVTAVATMALGFLENAGLPRTSMIFVWPLMGLVFGISVPFVRRRYR